MSRSKTSRSLSSTHSSLGRTSGGESTQPPAIPSMNVRRVLSFIHTTLDLPHSLCHVNNIHTYTYTHTTHIHIHITYTDTQRGLREEKERETNTRVNCLLFNLYLSKVKSKLLTLIKWPLVGVHLRRCRLHPSVWTCHHLLRLPISVNQ